MGSKEKGGLGFYSSSSSSNAAGEGINVVDVAREWRNAQAIPLSVTPDMVNAAKLELQFLADLQNVSSSALLQAGPTLDRAIKRFNRMWIRCINFTWYNNCWLPMLANEGKSFLVPPLDCAWVWHCHKLNPIQYAEDCKRQYGRLLGGHYIEPSRLAEATKKTKDVWIQHYPSEEYNLQLPWTPQPGGKDEFGMSERRIEYDLTGAVTRQSSFYYQVSQPYVMEDNYLHSAEQRYKGFLYLFAKLGGKGIFLVPTYDIDLMWHTHQLDPVAYNRDLLTLAGKILPHDDTDDNREEGAKLTTGFQHTKKLWEETFGSPYEKAGAMYLGPTPSSVAIYNKKSPCVPENVMFGNTYLKLREDQRQYLFERESVQLCVNVMGVRNLPPNKSGSHVFLCMKGIKNCGDFQLTTSEVDNHMLTSHWMIHCEKSTEGVVLELRSQPMGLFKILTGSKLLGEVRIAFTTVLASPTLAIQGWYAVSKKSDGNPLLYDLDNKPPALLLAASITPPVSSPYLLRAVNGRVQSDIFDRVKESQRAWHTGRWLTRIVLDHHSEEKYLVRVRKMKGRMQDCVPVEENEKEVHVFQRDPNMMKSKPWTFKSVEFAASAQQIMNTQTHKDNANVQREWCLLEKATHFTVRKTHDLHWDDHLEFELTGNVGYPAKLLPGRWLQYQVHNAKPEDESGFVTLIRYTPQCSTGKATALFNWKAAIMQVSVEENVMLVILLSTITALAVNDLLGTTRTKIVKATKKKHFPGATQWGAVIVDRRFEAHVKPPSTLIYNDWWLDPKAWAKEIYATEAGGYRGGSGCGGGGCGGASCAGGCGGESGGGPCKDIVSY